MPKFFDERRLVEELCRENNIRRVGGSASITREPWVPYPLKNIANLRVDFLKRAAEDRLRENRKMEELSFKEFKIQGIEAPANSLPPLSQHELLLRGDYRGHGDPVEPVLKVKAGAADFSALQDEFERALGNDFILFRQQYPQYNQSIVLSETFRTAEMQARELLRAWKNGKLVSTYGKGKIKENLFSFMLKIKNIRSRRS